MDNESLFMITICHTESPEEFMTTFVSKDKLTQEHVRKLCQQVAQKNTHLPASLFFAHVSFTIIQDA